MQTMCKENILLALFKQHHTQYQSRYSGINGSVKAVTGLFVLMTGWMLLVETPVAAQVRIPVTAFVVLIASLAIARVIVLCLTVRKIAQTIVKINKALRLYDSDVYLPGESIYPEEWENFGTHNLWGIISLCVQIILMCSMCVIAVWIR